jgi:hypothetical protein
MKRTLVLLLLAVIGMPNSLLALETVTWGMTESGHNGFRYWVSGSSLSCEALHTITDPAAREYVYESPLINGFTFHHMTATFEDGTESPLSEEVILKRENGAFVQATYEVSANGNDVMITWETIPSISSYQLECTPSGGGEMVTATISGGYHTINLPEGTWQIALFPKDALGRPVRTQNVYTTQSITSGIPAPPEPPQYKIEAFAANGIIGWNQTLMIPMRDSDPNIDHYLVNVHSSSALQAADGPGNVVANQIVEKNSNFCQTINTQSYPMLFVTMESVDTWGQTSTTANGAYVLIGNIIGTDNDSVVWNAAKNDGLDYNAIKAYYGKPVAHRSADYCADPNLFNILPFSNNERADYNLSGTVDGADLNFFKAVYGRLGSNY